MEPKNIHFGGGPVESVVNPIVLCLVLLAGVLIVISPRSKALAAFLAASILIPMDQVLVIAGLHFPMLRVLLLFGMARMIWLKASSHNAVFSGGINKIDLTVCALTLTSALAGVVLFEETQAVVFQLGNIFTVFGIYFLLRSLVRDKRDILNLVRTLAVVSAAIALVMSWEFATGHNPYALLGGARAASYGNIVIRDDRFRAMGSFGHPILAGTFGAILVPLFPLLWREGKRDRFLAALGLISATVITVTSNSSTPALAYVGGIIALCFWPLRRWTGALRWGTVIMLIGLHTVMKAPVWHLIARIDVTGGSSGYHRYQLVDQCIRHFADWWLIGVKSTQDWGWDMWDTANQYVGTCESSGLIPFLLFVATIVFGFKYLGRARRASRDRNDQVFLWMLNAALFANVVAFFGISYWDQTQVVWYGLLAVICTAFAISPAVQKSPGKIVTEHAVLRVEPGAIPVFRNDQTLSAS